MASAVPGEHQVMGPADNIRIDQSMSRECKEPVRESASVWKRPLLPDELGYFGNFS